MSMMIQSGRFGATDYPVAGIAAIYSLRKAASSYTGPVVKGKRVSDGAFMDFYPTDGGWIDTAAVSTWAAGSKVQVETWYDQSGNGRDATNSFGAPPDLAVTGTMETLGGHPAIRFGNSSTKTRLRLPFNLFTSSYTVVMGGTRTNAGTNAEWGTLLSALRNNDRNISLAFADNLSTFRPGLQQNGSSDIKAGTSTANGTPRIFSFKRNGAFVPNTTYTVVPYVDKVESTWLSLSFNGNALLDTYTSMGGAAASQGDRMTGLWTEFVFHFTDLSDTDREAIQNNMGAALGY